LTSLATAPARTALRLTNEELEAIRQFDACTLSNAIETFGVRLANEGFADASIRCYAAGCVPMLGYAVTARVQGSSVPITGQRYGDRPGWWEYLLTLPAPRVVVLQDMSDRPGFGSFLGEVHSTILMRLGCAGAVTNGAVRDLPAVEAMGFALFAGSAAVSHCYFRLVDFGMPVEVGGLRVSPGDLIFGDCHGVLSIPKSIAPRLPAAAARLVERERRIIDLCGSPDFSIESLRAMVSGQERTTERSAPESDLLARPGKRE
jgi:4-hydroxy-4-methyl-2-oxoglutarate aldolase